MHRIITRSAFVAVFAAFAFSGAGCKSAATKPPSESGSPSSPSSTSSRSKPSSPTASIPSKSPRMPSQPSASTGDSSSSQSRDKSRNNGDKGDKAQKGEKADGENADKTNSDRELAEVGESVARAADAVTRASEALAKAREKLAAKSAENQKGKEGSNAGDGDESAESSDEESVQASEGDPNYDPFAEPAGGGAAAAAAAAAVAQAAQSVLAAQRALEAESEAAKQADAESKQSRRERRESAEQREREQQSADDLADSAERLEQVSADLNKGQPPTPRADAPQDQTAREALTKAAEDLIRARSELIKAAVELGYLPEDVAQSTAGSELVFEDMETMVEFLEMSVELLATVIDLGGLPDFGAPEYDKSREAMARRGRTGSRRSDTQSGSSRGASGRTVADLEGELDRTLGEFDDEISNSRRSGRRGNGEVAGTEDDSYGNQGSGGSSAQPAGEDVFAEAGNSVPDSASGQSVGSNNRGNAPQVPDDLPDPQGDDVVARQLREAAMAETDPELKARLWEEYRTYRAAIGN